MLSNFKNLKNISRSLALLNSRKLFFSSYEVRSAKLDLQNLKSLRKRVVSKEISLQTLGSNAFGTSRSLFVNSPHYKILFNCGEGTKRIASEHGVDIGHVTSVFLTSNSWENVSGIPGLKDHVQHEIESFFKTYGPPGLKEVMTTYEQLDDGSYPHSKDFFEIQQLDKIDCDDIFQIQALPLYSSGVEYENHKNKRKYILAYICSIPTEIGKLGTEKLVAAGVPPGPLVRRLREGSSVTLPNGRTISPQEVSINVFKGTTFIVVEVPDFEFLDSLVSCKTFHRHQGGTNCLEEDIPEVIVHFTPPEIMMDARYRKWVNSFPPFVCHLVLNKKNTCLGLKSTIEMQLRLNQIHSKVFPLSANPGISFARDKISNPNQEDLINPFTLTAEYQFHGPTVQSNSLLQYCIRPRTQFNSSYCPVIYPQAIINSCFREEPVLFSLDQMNKEFQSLKSECSKKGKKFPTILFLGTGSAFPTNTRNVSSILINLSCQKSMMLDCGEGTFHQLVRFMGEKAFYSALRELQLVFISHHHKDHHIGLPTLLYERRKFFENVKEKPSPLYVFATDYVIKYLRDIHRLIPILDNVELLNNSNFVNCNSKDFCQYDEICDSLNFQNISMTSVRHCSNSYGIAFTHNDGWKIVYSGDTMPSQNLVNIGLNCDLLIHEATFEDGMETNAIQKRHSTVSQAINIGRKMNAKYIILNHFSQRYNKIPIVNEELIQNNVGIAFDFMKVTLEDLPYLPLMYPTLKELFHQDYESSVIKQCRRTHSSEQNL